MGFAVLFGLICVVVFQALTDFSPYLVYIRKRDLILSALLAMSLMWMMRVFVKYFYVSTFRVAKAERAFIYGVKQGGVSLAKSIQNQDRPVCTGRVYLGSDRDRESVFNGSQGLSE